MSRECQLFEDDRKWIFLMIFLHISVTSSCYILKHINEGMLWGLNQYLGWWIINLLKSANLEHLSTDSNKYTVWLWNLYHSGIQPGSAIMFFTAEISYIDCFFLLLVTNNYCPVSADGEYWTEFLPNVASSLVGEISHIHIHISVGEEVSVPWSVGFQVDCDCFLGGEVNIVFVCLF